MSVEMPHRENVLQQALALPTSDRAYVAALLNQSLEQEAVDPEPEPAPEDDSGLLAELQRRSAAYRTGLTTARPAADVLADQKRRQAAEAQQ